jgi:hypothetical protein
MENLAQPGEGGGGGGWCTPTPFHYIYHRVQSCGVRSAVERADTLPLFQFYSYMYSVVLPMFLPCLSMFKSLFITPDCSLLRCCWRGDVDRLRDRKRSCGEGGGGGDQGKLAVNSKNVAASSKGEPFIMSSRGSFATPRRGSQSYNYQCHS